LESSLNKDDLYDSIIQPLASRHKVQSGPTFCKWVEESHLTIGRKPFTFEKHEYLKTPYEDDHPFQVHMKAVQMGLTTKAMLRVIYKAHFKNYEGILYFFPSRTDVSDLSRARFNPLVKRNPATIGNWVADTDQTNLKMISDTPVYFRGMKSAIGVQSAPGDYIVFDELDLANQSTVDVAMDRLDHSEEGGEVEMLSKPSLPDYGIARAFLLTDQRYWLLKCSGCNTWNDLVELFPKCFVEKTNGEVIRACVKCGKELDPTNGQWVAKKPSITDKRGYQYSQLYAQFPRSAPKILLDIFKKGYFLKNFHNQKIGNPYIESENRLSIEEVKALCGSDGISQNDTAPCFMGVDQGMGLHVVIGKDDEAKAGKIIHLNVYKDWIELDGLMKNFNITRAVVDAQPEMRNARSFAEKFKGRVFLNFYSESQRGAYKWDEADLKVNCNRTESLDASHNEIKFAQVILPCESDMVEEFAKHLHNVGKKLEEDEETGSKRYVYVKLGVDHFRHAYNYECMARQHASGLLYPELL
jgi:hypothetical protein